jgi:hypothetical protein
MKTKYFILAALAGIILASCSSDELAGDNGLTTLGQVGDGSINFGFNVPNATRADLYGGDAATKLGNKFVITIKVV